MTEWTDVEHREEVQARRAEPGEVVHTLAGPQRAGEDFFVIRRRNVPRIAEEASTEDLRAQYQQRYGQAAPEDTDREALYAALGYGWDERLADRDYVDHHFKLGALDSDGEDDEDRGEDDGLVPPYDQYKVPILAAEIDRRDIAAEVEEPGNKPELVAALEAFDERQG